MALADVQWVRWFSLGKPTMKVHAVDVDGRVACGVFKPPRATLIEPREGDPRCRACLRAIHAIENS